MSSQDALEVAAKARAMVDDWQIVDVVPETINDVLEEAAGVIETLVNPPGRYGEWHKRFIAEVKVPSGLDYADPQFIAELVTRFLTSLQLMNKDAYEAGLAAAKEAS